MRLSLSSYVWAVSFLGCAPTTVETSDVVQLTICPAISADAGSGGCSRIPAADGQSTVTVQICAKSDSVSNSGRKTDLTATLHSTRGSWLGHSASDPTTVSVPFGSSSCRLATLVVDQTVGANQIDATLLGYTVSETILQVPAGVSHADFSAVNLPPLVGTGSATVQLKLSAQTDTGGLPSFGTRVGFGVQDVNPSGTVAMSQVASTLGSDGTVSFSIFVPAAVESFTVVGTVTSPATSDGTRPSPFDANPFSIARQ